MSKTIIIIGAGIGRAFSGFASGGKWLQCKTGFSTFPSERAQSVMAEGGMGAALEHEKMKTTVERAFFTDTIKAACGLADQMQFGNDTGCARAGALVGKTWSSI